MKMEVVMPSTGKARKRRAACGPCVEYGKECQWPSGGRAVSCLRCQQRKVKCESAEDYPAKKQKLADADYEDDGGSEPEVKSAGKSAAKPNEKMSNKELLLAIRKDQMGSAEVMRQILPLLIKILRRAHRQAIYLERISSLTELWFDGIDVTYQPSLDSDSESDSDGGSTSSDSRSDVPVGEEELRLLLEEAEALKEEINGAGGMAEDEEEVAETEDLFETDGGETSMNGIESIDM
ncbi:hypothetical protein NM688_g4003 [Phlebia brevispora]|uniref:Uncharacterized protein n=1 Tax=Phlebia brevispora TaxID=194682 RepID=A0ACC1T4I7_9APHY|nr:hypothetical protein NM688_g4003 [Phlebia brevispora]